MWPGEKPARKHMNKEDSTHRMSLVLRRGAQGSAVLDWKWPRNFPVSWKPVKLSKCTATANQLLRNSRVRVAIVPMPRVLVY